MNSGLLAAVLWAPGSQFLVKSRGRLASDQRLAEIHHDTPGV